MSELVSNPYTLHRSEKPPRPVKAWAAIYPEQQVLTIQSLCKSAAEAWDDCLSSLRYRVVTQGIGTPAMPTRAQARAAGYRVVRVRVVADE